MKWIDVQEDLPKDEEQVLALLEGYFYQPNDPLRQTVSFRIFQCSVNRSNGWKVPYLSDPHYVKYWMPLPKPPKE